MTARLRSIHQAHGTNSQEVTPTQAMARALGGGGPSTVARYMSDSSASSAASASLPVPFRGCVQRTYIQAPITNIPVSTAIVPARESHNPRPTYLALPG